MPHSPARLAPRPAALLALALLLGLRPAGALGAQRADETGVGLAAGSRVRVTHPALGRAVGHLAAAPADSLRLERGDGRGAATVSLAGVTRLDVSAGRRQRKLKGALLGLLLGAASGAAIGAATYEPCEGLCIVPETRGTAAAIVGVFGGLVGAGVGTLTGALWKGERWEQRPLTF